MRAISRRDFLKMGAASAAVLAIESQLGPIARAAELLDGGRSVDRTSGITRYAFPSTCTQCPAGCGNIGYVEEGRLVKIGGNPAHLENASTLCARGQAGINALYDPDRLLKPVKRVGPRGGGKWQQIGWDDALNQVAAKMSAARGNPGGFVFMTDDLSHDYLGQRFTYAFGSGNALGAAGLYDANKQVATALTWGAAGDTPDVSRTKYILLFAANPLESNPSFVGLARRLVEGAQQNHAKVVLFDSRLTNTSALANEVHFVKPGTMALVALAMANVIMQQGLSNNAFIAQWTNVSPGQLSQHLAQYTPERAEAETGVSAQVIKSVAADYAGTSPATTLTDANLSGHANGVQSERAAMLLNIITGNIDTKGGLCLPRQSSLAEPQPAPPAPAGGALTSPGGVAMPLAQSAPLALKTVKDGQAPVSVLMTHQYNPVYSAPDGGFNAAVLKDESKIPFHVAVTPFLNESAAYADIILPETTYLEDSDIEVRPSTELVPFVALRQPVVTPMKGSRSFFDISTALAKRIGGGMERFFGFSSVDDYLKARIAGIAGLAQAGGLDYLKKQGVWFDPKGRPTYGTYQAGGFSTGSGKLEVYSAALAAKGQSALPVYEPVDSLGKLNQNELVMSIYDTALQTDGKTANCMWLDEIVHNDPAFINPDTASRLGITDGQSIKLTRSAKSGSAQQGSIRTTAFISEGVHPQVIALAGGVGHTGFGRVAQGEKISDDDISNQQLKNPNYELIWWREQDGIGANAKQIVPIKVDPIGGGAAWGDVIVKVEKA